MDRIGRYHVIQELGRGGMGQVFVARDPELDRKVAIKLLYPARAGVVSLRDEARALAALSHPNIVTIYEVGRQDEQPFIAMEYLPGRPLHDLLRGAERPPRDALVAIAGKVASALAAAHAAGILHRDIKPENVIVDGERVTVVDFGIAQRLGEVGDAPAHTRERAAEVANALTQTLPLGDTRTTAAETPTIFGTPAYMAPEVLGGVPASTASDVYSLGVLLYECLAGRRPYEAPNLVEVIALVIDGAPIPPLADPLGELVARMLARDPSDRPALAEVRKRLAPEPPRRSRALPIALAGIAAAAVLGAGLVAWRSRATGATEPVRIGIGTLRTTTPSYGAMPLDGESTGDVLARLLANVPGITAISPLRLRDEDPDAIAASRALQAQLVVRGTIEEHAGRVDAHLELLDLGRGTSSPIDASVAGVAQMAQLLVMLGDAIAERGMTQFLRVLELEPNFAPAAVHASAYALGCRDRTAAERLVAASGRAPDRVALAFGDYAGLAEHAVDPVYKVYAQLVLGREPALAIDPQNRLPYRLARAAAAGDLARARQLFAEALPALSKQPLGESTRADLEDLLRVLLTAQLAPEAAQALAVYREGAVGRFRHGVQHFGVLLAPLVTPPPEIPRDGMTTRNRAVAAAIDAELAGDRARAVELLRALIADPGDFWDYPERAALIRNLVALGRTRDVRAACAEAVLRPAIPRDEMIPLRATCRHDVTAGR